MAEKLTGWSAAEASGHALEEIFRIVHEESLAPVDSPVPRVLREGKILGLANHTLLIARDGRHTPIADSAAPILNDQGAVAGAVLVFGTSRINAEPCGRSRGSRRSSHPPTT